MGFIVKVECASETIDLSLESIQTLEFSTDTPKDSNARSTDLGSTVKITGKILTAVDGDPADSTVKLSLWSMVPVEKADCYRKLTVDVISAGQVVRQINLPNAFVVDYQETYGDTEGVGTFSLIVKQKKDKLANIVLNGGYPAA
jgi:hypothetical protein